MHVLMVYPRLPQSFWSFDQVVKLYKKRAVFPPLGLTTVAALMPQSWHYRLVDLNYRPLTEDDWQWADVVFVSGMLVQKDGLLQLVAEAKARGKFVVAGGPYTTALPHEVQAAGCDLVVVGELEDIVAEVVDAILQRQRGLLRATTKPDITKSPIPRYDLIEDLTAYFVVGLQASRGCPFDCEFCDVVATYGRDVRVKTPAQVTAELQRLCDLGWYGDVFITDDNFIAKRAHVRELLAAIIAWQRERGYPHWFETQASIDLARDDSLIDLMVQANFRYVSVGVESPDESVLASIHKAHNLRNPMAEAILHLRKRGLGVIANMILGFDGERPGMGSRIAEFVAATDVPMVYLNVLQALPNTKLWKRLELEQRLLAEHTSGQTTGGKLNFVPSRPAQEIAAEYEGALKEVYRPRNYFRRAHRYSLAGPPYGVKVIQQAESKARYRFKWPSFGYIADNVKLLSRLVYRTGVLARYRLLFWKYLVLTAVKRPKATLQYLSYAALSEDLFRVTPAELTKGS